MTSDSLYETLLLVVTKMICLFAYMHNLSKHYIWLPALSLKPYATHCIISQKPMWLTAYPDRQRILVTLSVEPFNYEPLTSPRKSSSLSPYKLGTKSNSSSQVSVVIVVHQVNYFVTMNEPHHYLWCAILNSILLRGRRHRAAPVGVVVHLADDVHPLELLL